MKYNHIKNNLYLNSGTHLIYNDIGLMVAEILRENLNGLTVGMTSLILIGISINQTIAVVLIMYLSIIMKVNVVKTQ